MKKIIAIVGPTASGKSELAVRLAKKFNGEVISADSRQVYKDLDIGSGKITRKEMKSVPHHLLDVASPKRIFTAARYKKLAERAIKKIVRRGKLPVIAGGTGFYIDTLLYGYALPAVPPNPKLRKRLEKLAAEELFKLLRKLDPRRAKNIERKNRRRLIRAIEIIKTTGRAVPPPPKKKSDYEILKIGIKKSPEELKKLISQRLRKRLKKGMIAEVKKLRRNGLSWKRLDDFGLEYRYISRHLRGLISKKEMVESLEKEIYRYTKRQITWFRAQPDIQWVNSYTKAQELVKDFLRSSEGA